MWPRGKGMDSETNIIKGTKYLQQSYTKPNMVETAQPNPYSVLNPWGNHFQWLIVESEIHRKHDLANGAELIEFDEGAWRD